MTAITILAAWLLIVTGTYTADGTDIAVRFETETKTETVCRAIESSIWRTLTSNGAQGVEGRCEEK